MSTEERLFTVDEEIDLAQTQNIRRRLMESLVGNNIPDKDGKVINIPEKENQVLLLGLLDGADKAVFNKAKIRQQNKANENNSNITRSIAEILKTINPNTYTVPALPEERDIPDKLVKKEFLPGELTIGNIQYEGESDK